MRVLENTKSLCLHCLEARDLVDLVDACAEFDNADWIKTTYATYLLFSVEIEHHLQQLLALKARAKKSN